VEYHKIETLYERDPITFKLKPELILKNRVYGLLKTWEWTEKIDGTNIRVMWHNNQLTFGGKTDKAQIPKELLEYLCDYITREHMELVFPDCDAVIYGEGYGYGIQKAGSGYSLYKRFIIFDVLVDGKWWLAWENVCDVAKKLGLPTVPYLGTMTLEEATEKTRNGFLSAIHVCDDVQAEGMVGRPLEALFDKKGHRLITKLKTKDFA
jgi:ATP-dependent RNA circularization protein (DNA/RNA ligase family)